MNLIDLVHAADNEHKALDALPDPERRREIRTLTAVTQGQLAAAVGASEGAVRRWEAGEAPKIAAHEMRYLRVLGFLASYHEARQYLAASR